MEKPDKPGSALLRVLNRSVALNPTMPVELGPIEQFTGERTDTQQAKKAYADLLAIVEEIDGLIKPEWTELMKRLKPLGEMLEKWGDPSAPLDTKSGSREGREKAIKEQIAVARKLREDVLAEGQRASEAEKRREQDKADREQCAKDLDKIDETLAAVGKLEKMDIGQAPPPKTAGFRKTLAELRGKVEQGLTLTGPQRVNSIDKELKALTERFVLLADARTRELEEAQRALAARKLQEEEEREEATKAAQLLQARQAREEKARQESLAQARRLKEWQEAVQAAVDKALEWEAAVIDDGRVIKSGVAIDPDAFEAELKALRKASRTARDFQPGQADDATVAKAVETEIENAGLRLEAKAARVQAESTAKVVEAVDHLTEIVAKDKKPVGSPPLVAQARKAAKACGIPGLHEQVLAEYGLRHKDTEPQRELQAKRRSSERGEREKWLRVGPWMHEVGMGGSARPSSAGPVFMMQARTIGKFPSHVSQYLNNARVPPNGLDSTVDEAMQALFADADNRMGPHLTLERSPRYGAPENARLFKGSGAFAPGNLSADEMVPTRQAMQSELDQQMAFIRVRLAMLLGD